MGRNVRIHIVCPSDDVTGSAESLHQFGRAAATLGYDARIAYGGDPVFGAVASAFRSYGLRNDQDVTDAAGLVVLTAHTDVAAVEGLSAARKLVWWLRLDETAGADVERALALPGAVHIAQSEYARRFLAARGVAAGLVGDYVPASFVDHATALVPATKLDTVLYNPDPTDAFTPQLVEASRGVLQWVPVAGLAPAEVAELMAYSKVYVDFGAHAGRTRMPREAIAAGCAVITGSRGAGGNELDLALPEGFRFDESVAEIRDVLNRIALTVLEFDGAVPAFTGPRAALAGQEVEFRGAVGDVIEKALTEAGLAELVKRPAAPPTSLSDRIRGDVSGPAPQLSVRRLAITMPAPAKLGQDTAGVQAAG